MSAVLASPLVPPLAYVIQDRLLKQRGILHVRDLFQEYGDSHAKDMITAIKWLQDAALISVKGNLNTPLAVFQLVLATR